MRIDAVSLPAELTSQLLEGRTAVVFDVLRATSSIVTALANGATAVRVYPDHATLLAAAKRLPAPTLTAGETRCVKPEGFDLGNSPGRFTHETVADKTVLLSTTNGTRAIFASVTAKRILAGSVLNATAVARELLAGEGDVTLVCAGTEGQISDDDRCGCGAVLDRFLQIDGQCATLSESARRCLDLFRQHTDDLPGYFRTTISGQNILRAHLDEDIDFAAQIDRFDLVPLASASDAGVIFKQLDR